MNLAELKKPLNIQQLVKGLDTEESRIYYDASLRVDCYFTYLSNDRYRVLMGTIQGYTQRGKQYLYKYKYYLLQPRRSF